MSNPEPTIRINVDVTNPGQFFACCGLLELANRLWPGAEGWFARYPIISEFCLWTPKGDGSLKTLLEMASKCEFDVGDDDNEEADDDEEKAGPVDPIIIRSPVEMTLDWWSDKSIKPWAGSMQERVILRAMLRAISPEATDLFNIQQVVSDAMGGTTPANKKGRKKKPKKREPFYFDSRRGSKAHPLDSGWSPDTHKREHKCAPAVEAFCFLGLQRCRPMPTERQNISRYTVWSEHLPVNVIAPVISGTMRVPRSLIYEFSNFFRTDQRKHKAFGEAKRVDRL
jgi:CRISPR-associated protein Csb3